MKWLRKVYDRVVWFISELAATCSEEDSYFSKKRIQAWLLFDAALGSMMIWFYYHYKDMDYSEIIMFASVLFAAAGYQIGTIQKEKRFNKKNEV